MVIRHRCSNPWCANPWHYDVATKQDNDTEEHCHHFMRQMTAFNVYNNFTENVCRLFHNGMCWTNNYTQLEDLNPNRLSFSQPPPPEEAGVDDAAEPVEFEG